MSLVSKEKTGPATWKISVNISAADFNARLDETAKKQLQTITLPGFRKGKAPRSMVEKRYGENVFYDETLDALLPGAVADALAGAELTPYFRPEDLEVQEIGKDKGVEFTFTVICAPEITIENYKGLEVAVPSPDVTDADVDARVLELQKRNARQVEVEARPAQNGDVAVIDFAGFLEGAAFAGGTAENHELTLGSGQFIPGFEEQVVGHAPGDRFDVNVTFPEEYHSQELAGKEVVFKVTLHELKAEELPEVDDDFAQEVGEEYNTVADLRAGITKELADSKKEQHEEAFDHGVQDQLAALLEGEIPDAIFDRRAQQNIEMFAERIQIPLERYLELMGENEEAFRARMKEQSAEQVKRELALEKVAELEGIAPTAEEIEAEYQRLADQYKVDTARVKFAVPEAEIVKDLSRVKALEFVKGAAVKTIE